MKSVLPLTKSDKLFNEFQKRKQQAMVWWFGNQNYYDPRSGMCWRSKEEDGKVYWQYEMLPKKAQKVVKYVMACRERGAVGPNGNQLLYIHTVPDEKAFLMETGVKKQDDEEYFESWLYHKKPFYFVVPPTTRKGNRKIFIPGLQPAHA